MKDELLDNITWKKDKEGWTAIITLANGKTATIIIDIPPTDESIPEPARKCLQFVIENEPSITHKIAASITELYKDWNDNETITPEELAQKINLDYVTISEEGDGQLCYKPDGDFFTDHYVCAWFNANGEVDEPGLEG